ncbi:MAG TPA: DUF2255 family protein [Microlunatus sp.]|nr:DUF2255 family protein [Microlunatus sp.]
MTSWTAEELSRIAAADDLHVAPYRADGATLGTPTWIWSVVVEDHLYVRPYHGEHSRWYQSAITQGAGQITTAGHTYDVSFAPANPTVLDAVDAAYRAKYATSSYLAPMVAAGPRATTLRISPTTR